MTTTAVDLQASSRTDAPVLACRHLTRRFGQRVAVDDVSLEIRPSETYGLLGPNGAGKTTTIRMICGLLGRETGEVTVTGRPVDGRTRDGRAAIGYVPQEIALYPDLSARENLRFFGRLYGLRGAALNSRVDAVLEVVDLRDRADDRVDAFSGGMQRRLNIGAGLVHEPALLILDEPTVGVDPQSRHAILEAVHNLGLSGTAVLYTTHYMEEAERLCDRIGIIDHGRMVAEGNHRELVDLVGERDRVELKATGDLDAFARACTSLAEVESASAADGMVHVLTGDGRRVLPRLFELAEANHAVVNSVRVVEPDLEAVFLHLTGSALRE